MAPKLECPGELEMISHCNHYFRMNGKDPMKTVDQGYKFLKGEIKEFEYLTYMDQLSSLYLKIRFLENEEAN